jgi:hypothetical protein
MITGAGEFGDCFGSAHRAYTYGCGTHAWATYTAVPVGTSNTDHNASVGGKSLGTLDIGLWWTAIGFFSGRGGASSPNVTLYEADLAPMVDATSLPSPDFGTVPTASFQSNGGYSISTAVTPHSIVPQLGKRDLNSCTFVQLTRDYCNYEIYNYIC